MSQLPTLSATTLAAINTVGRWLAQNDFTGNITVQSDCVILAGNAVIPTIDAACRIAKEQQVPLLISGGIGHSTRFLYDAIAQHPRYNIIRTTGRAEAAILPILLTSSGKFRVRKFGWKISRQTAVRMPGLAVHY